MRHMIFCAALALLSVGGCPMPGAEGNLGSKAAPTGIPAGTYRGESTWTISFRVNGQEIESERRTESSDSTVIIDADGRLFNCTSGQATTVGDVVSSNLADVSITGTTTSITASGNTITEQYDVVWVEGGVTFTGEGVDRYIYTGSAIDIQYSVSVAKRRQEDNALLTVSFKVTGTLTK